MFTIIAVAILTLIAVAGTLVALVNGLPAERGIIRPMEQSR